MSLKYIERYMQEIRNYIERHIADLVNRSIGHIEDVAKYIRNNIITKYRLSEERGNK